MLELGQWVRINRQPTFGDEYFDTADINTRDWIAGIYECDGQYVYELRDQDDDCLWTEDELTRSDDFEELFEPSFWLGDEVRKNNDEDDIRTIIAVSTDGDDVLYKLDKGWWYYDSELTLHRKKDDVHPEYTLF